MKSVKRALCIFLAAVLALPVFLLAVGCKDETAGNAVTTTHAALDPDAPQTALFSFSDVELTGGDRYRIVPRFAPDSYVKYDEIEYSVVEGAEAVSVEGYYITAKAEGEALICAEYVTDRSVYSTFRVRVDMKDGLYKISDYVYASRKGGTYSKTFNLRLEPSSERYKIYYTFDCSTPTKASEQYTSPLSIRDRTNYSDYPLTKAVLSEPIDGAGLGKCVSNDYLNNIERRGVYPEVGCGTVLTYSVYDGDKLLETSSVTYIIKENADEYFTVPVVCLSMPFENWFDGSEGIYNIVYHDLRSRAYLEYYDSTTGESFKVNTSVKVGGGWSRGYPKRTLNLNFTRDENGEKNDVTNVAFFGEVTADGDSGTLIAGLSRLRLHNSGNTYESGCMFGDAFFQEISKETNCSTTSYRPCLVYLNGEFWGYYGLREQYSASFFKNNYGIDKDDVILTSLVGNKWEIAEGDPSGTKSILNSLLNYCKKDFTNDEIYNTFIEKYVDKDSFIDALILEGFAHNWDYVANNNNFRMWRTSVVKEGVPYYDGKWRVCLHDMDFALQHNTGNYLVPKEYTNTKSNDYSYDKFAIYNKLLSNASFRSDLVARVKELFSTVLAPERTVAILDLMAEQFRPLFKDNAKRWGIGYSKDAWQNSIQQLRERLSNRAGYFVATTLAMYEPFAVDDSNLVTVDNLGSDTSSDNSEEFKLNSKSFELEFYMNNDEYSKADGRAFIKLTSKNKYFIIYWGVGLSSSQWMSGAIADGASSADIDYINVGRHKINIKYSNGSVTLTVDDYFIKTFSVESGFGTVESFSFGGMQSKVSINRIKAVLVLGQGETKEVKY